MKVNGGDGLIITTTNRTLKQNRCYCATRELPKVEYYIIDPGSDFTSRIELINEAVLDGWRLMPSADGSWGYSTMWRWAE